MKKFTSVLMLICMLAGVFGIAVTPAAEADAADGTFTVALDPGHDNSHGGASYYGFTEQEKTLKIANYLKEELEQYSNVNVYMTRTTNDCPYPETAGDLSARDIEKRFQAAKDHGADIYVSLHLNASESASPSGAEVICCNDSWKPYIGQESRRLGESILDELSAAGLNRRSVYSKNTTIDERYPDGSISDYYAVHVSSKDLDVPGIIVEHCFMTNYSDVSRFLATEEGLQTLARADAAGIAKAYNLTKGLSLQVTGKDDFAGVAKINVRGGSGNTTAYVWNEKQAAQRSEEEVRKTYTFESGSGTIDFNVSDFGGQRGVYHVRATDLAGQSAETSFRVSEDLDTVLDVTKVDEGGMLYKITLKFDDMPDEITAIRFYVWSGQNQDDMKWYYAQQTSPGVWEKTISIADHSMAGDYSVHVYRLSEAGEVMLTNGWFSAAEPRFALSAKDSDERELSYDLKASNLILKGDFVSARFAVWSIEGGQDDLIWYEASRDKAGDWTATVNIANHGTAGDYAVHFYATGPSGEMPLIADTGFKVSKVTVSKYETENYEKDDGSFDVVIEGVNSPSGVESVSVAVWSEPDQSNITWYSAQREGDGNYRAHVKISNHGYKTGAYLIDTYLTAGNKVGWFDRIFQNVETPNVNIIATDAGGGEREVTLRVSNLGMIGDFISARFAVWSIEGGQDDLIWYEASRDQYGDWTATVNIANHRTAGDYAVHFYATGPNGEMPLIADTGFKIREVTVTKYETENYVKDEGSFDVVIEGINSPSGVESVSVAVWSEPDQSNITWYSAQREEDGKYRAHVKISNHGYKTGAYLIDTYLTAGNKVGWFDRIFQNVETPSVNISATDAGGSEREVTVKVSNLGVIGDFVSARFAVWSIEGGQDDLIWYEASRDQVGDWTATVNIANHGTSGDYAVHFYATGPNGEMPLIADTGFKIREVTVTKYETENYVKDDGSFDIVIEGVNSPSGVESVSVAVWSEPDQSNITWYSAQREEDGNYRAHVKISNHGYKTGAYLIDTYLTAGNKVGWFDRIFQNVETPNVNISATDVGGGEKEITLKVSNLGVIGDFVSARFAVWSIEGGQDDLIWYEASRDQVGDWTATVNIANHRTSGDYAVHFYATGPNGEMPFIADTGFNIIGAGIDSVSVENYDAQNGVYDLRIRITAPSGVSSLLVPVWSMPDQSDIIWYSPKAQPDGSYLVHVDSVNHNCNAGTYHNHIYLTAGNGISDFYAAEDVQIDSSGYYTVMGVSTVTVEQMESFLRTRLAQENREYPAEVFAPGGAPDVGTFCRIFFEEAALEGVRAEVAFAQSMLETGFLKFGGIVQPGQFNFAGIGATDQNAPGECAAFPDVRTGVRAQIQHLKAYACTDDLRNDTVDPRFDLVERGCARYVQWLGQKENPLGKGWATGEGYGYNIVRLINELKQY